MVIRLPVRRLRACQLRACLLMLSCVHLLLSLGCDDPKFRRPRENRSQSQLTPANIDSHLAIALNRLEQLDVGIYFGHDARNRIAYHLQEWGKQQRADPDWIADPMLSRLPSRLRFVAHPEVLPSLQFRPSDVTYLIESVMVRDVSNQAVSKPLFDLSLQKELDEQRATLEDDHGDKLLQAVKLFDWTVRNLQLEPLDPPLDDAEEPPEVPTPRPGARRFVWQSLLIGRADAWTRARTFILLARQQRIPVLILAVDQEPDPRPWLAAARIGDELYLFDPELGLPLPADNGRGIATLRQLRDHPEWLSQNHVPDGPQYPWTANDLNRLVALIDAVPEALSQRMAVLERALTGEHKMVLTVEASPLASQLQSSQLVLRSQIWTQPYDTQMYHLSAATHRPTQIELQKELQPLEGDQPLARARRLHLRGIYDNDPPRNGARAWYMMARPSDRDLEAGENLTDKEIQEEIATRLDLPDEIRNNTQVLREIMAIAREKAVWSKQAASYWLGIVTFEHEQFDAAIDFFKTRTLEASPDGPWTEGARYNLARTYELLGERDQDPESLTRAVSLLRENAKAPQAHGNLLRAQRIAEHISAPSETTNGQSENTSE